MKKYNITKDTPILPELIADRIFWEMAAFIKFKIKDNKLADELENRSKEFINLLVEKQDSLYQNSVDWRKKMRSKGNKGRDTLYSFMQHWLSGLLKDNMPNVLKKLPNGYSNGETLVI